ncbi:MAG: DUF2066 domain-containing protein [Gammaproteobacteria bacterium]|nr:DUF2066 domain-containing protein [Gammaproteobacteria bacterium]
MKSPHLLFFVLLLTSWIFLSTAAVGRDLYQIETLVEDRSDGQRQQAMSRAMGEMVVRISGDVASVRVPALRNRFDSAAAYILQYSYQQTDDLLLKMTFDEQAIIKLLRDQGIAIWGNSRPLTMVWLAVEDQRGRRLVAQGEGSAVENALYQTGRERGLPLLLPKMDAVDRRMVKIADVWGGFYEVVIDASHRYSAQASLIGKLSEERSGSWRISWNLFEGDFNHQWSATGRSPELLVATGVHGASDQISQRYLQTGGGSEERLLVTVTGIASFDALVRVNDLLRAIDGVEFAYPATVTAGDASFYLMYEGERQRLQQRLALSSELRPAPPQAGQERGGEASIHYLYRPQPQSQPLRGGE